MNCNNLLIDKLIDLVFVRYQLYKIRIKVDGETDADCEKIKQMKKYVFILESLLNLFSETDRNFLIDVHVNKKTWVQLHCSESTFYYKKRKCHDLLYKYIAEYDDSKWTQLPL